MYVHLKRVTKHDRRIRSFFHVQSLTETMLFVSSQRHVDWGKRAIFFGMHPSRVGFHYVEDWTLVGWPGYGPATTINHSRWSDDPDTTFSLDRDHFEFYRWLSAAAHHEPIASLNTKIRIQEKRLQVPGFQPFPNTVKTEHCLAYIAYIDDM